MTHARTLRALLLGAALMAPLALQPGVRAQDANADANVVATVNGEIITETDVEAARAELGEALSRVPAGQQSDFLVSFLVDMKLLAQEGRRRDFDKAADFEQRLDFMRDRLLMQDVLDGTSASAVTDDALKAFYDDNIAGQTGDEEVRARHILLESEEKAKEVKQEIEGGKDFAEAAKEHSTGPTGPQGGDLGFFGKGQMVPEFGDVAFSQEPGTVSDPVKTQFGWHLIKVEEKRTKEPPAFDAVKAQIGQHLQRQAQSALIQKLREDAEIEQVGADEAEADKPAQ